jgi:threonine dehydratase
MLVGNARQQTNVRGYFMNQETRSQLGKVNLAKIKEARTRISKIVSTSPLKHSIYLEKKVGVRVLLKLENLNVSGSFKIRGASNALLQLSPEELRQGIIAASAGNHAQGVAFSCHQLGASATIFMPERTPLVKAEATRELGADVRIVGKNYDEAFQAATEYQQNAGGVFIHAFANSEVINGQGTIGLELLDQVPDLGLVIGSIGGGGMMSGVSCALKETRPDVKIVGVQAVSFPAVQQSYKEGRIVTTSHGSTIADGIAVKRPNELTIKLLEKYIDDIILVDEQEIASAVMDLMERDHLLAEGAGAASVAALLQLDPKLLASMQGKSIVCIISGGNIDVNLLHRIIPHGMKYSGRFMRVAVRIADRPGHLAEILNIIGSTGANLQEVHHNRLFGAKGYEDVEVQLDLETTNLKHQEIVFEALTKAKVKHSALE